MLIIQLHGPPVCTGLSCSDDLRRATRLLLQLLDHRSSPSRCIPAQTKLDCSIAPLLHLPSSIAFSSKQLTFWLIFTTFTLFTHDKSPTFNALFHLSLQLPPRPSPFLHLHPPVTRPLLLPSGMHHHNLPHHKRLQPPLLHHHHHHHHPRRNVSPHHLLKRMLIGMLGTATLKFASLNSRPTPASDPIGTTLLVEWASQLNSARPAGKNFKKHNANKKLPFPHPHHVHLHPPHLPIRHHHSPLPAHLPL